MRVLHIASSPNTIDLFVRPLQKAAEADGTVFGYLDAHDFEEVNILRRGLQSIKTWRYRNVLTERITAFRPDVLVAHTPSTALSLLPMLRSFQGRRVFISRGGFQEGRGPVIAAGWSSIDPSRWPFWDRIGAVNSEQLVRLQKVGVDALLLPLGGLNLGGESISDGSQLQSPFTLGWVGRFDKDKQLEIFLKLISRLRCDGHDVQAIVVGDVIDGDRGTTARLQKDYAHLPIRWTGWIADPQFEYARMSLLVSTSRREGYGRAVIEAARAGVPTVGFATEGTRQSITDAAGIAVQSGTLVDLVSICAQLMTHKQDYENLRSGTLRAAKLLANIEVWETWRELLA